MSSSIIISKKQKNVIGCIEINLVTKLGFCIFIPIQSVKQVSRKICSDVDSY